MIDSTVVVEVVVVMLGVVVVVQCYGDSLSGYHSTKALYSDTVRTSDTTSFPGPTDDIIHMTGLFRHGVRYPSTNMIRKMRKLCERIREEARGESSLIKSLKSYDFFYSDSDDAGLARPGWAEMEELGRRVAANYPLITSSFKDKSIRITSSSRSRCVESGRAFISGVSRVVTGEAGEVPNIHTNDTLLRFFDFCPRYDREVGGAVVVEREKFGGGREMEGVVKSVERLLGGTITLTYGDIHVLMMLCTFHRAIKVTRSPWCRLFTTEHAQIVDYYLDMKHYWKWSYGSELSYNMACDLLRAVVTDLTAARRQHHSGAAVTRPVSLMFGHAETILPLLSLLHLYKDDTQLTADNFRSLSAHRKFRLSRVMPFAANVMLVLSRDTVSGEYHVTLLHNEAVVKLPWCRPHLTSPHLASPHLTSPHLTSPHLTSCPHHVFSQSLPSDLSHCDLPRLCATSRDDL